MNARSVKSVQLSEQISHLARELEKIPEGDRLFVIAEAMMQIKDGERSYESCGCFEWDIIIDYRDAEERHGKEAKAKPRSR